MSYKDEDGTIVMGDDFRDRPRPRPIRPRRAKPRRAWGTDFLLVVFCFTSGFIGGFLGTVVGSMW